MNVLGGITARPSNDNATVLIIPLQDGTRTDPEFLADLRWNRDLTLRGEF